jgi:rubrerythrin
MDERTGTMNTIEEILQEAIEGEIESHKLYTDAVVVVEAQST